MVQQALNLLPDSFRGSVRVSASNVPNGHVTITRSSKREIPTIIRNGEFDLTTGGFLRQDTDPSFGIPITYRATVTGIPQTTLQTNRVLNPKFRDNMNNWTPGTGRTVARETSTLLTPARDATTSLRIGGNASGSATNTLSDRLLVSTNPSGLTAGRWFVTGQVRFDNADLWLWDDVKAGGTWATIQSKGTWQQLKSNSSETAGAVYTSLWVGAINGSGASVSTPVQVLGMRSDAGNNWMTFNAWVTVPAGATGIGFYQGNQVREFANVWWLTTVMVTPEAEATTGMLPYFDGDTPLPDNPAANMVPDMDWQAVSTGTADASIAWNGTSNNSVSVFTGPSAITATAVYTLPRPNLTSLKISVPVLITDPVSPTLGQWFELLKIGDLSFKERADLYDVLGKSPVVAVSQARAWASGQLALMTRTLADIDLVERMFQSGRILLMRNPDPRFPESDWYLHIGEVGQGRLGADQTRPERAWTVPFVRVERPVGLIESAAGTTWGQAKTGYLSWGDARTKRSDWLAGALEPAQ